MKRLNICTKKRVQQIKNKIEEQREIVSNLARKPEVDGYIAVAKGKISLKDAKLWEMNRSHQIRVRGLQ